MADLNGVNLPASPNMLALAMAGKCEPAASRIISDTETKICKLRKLLENLQTAERSLLA